ncbi:MAG: hypothetical protein FJX92_01015 [Bacteroidetes bacterium]|nr:hypothetical protein [Bacteroidota bacterium]
MNDTIRNELISAVGFDLPETNWKIRLIDEIRYLLEHDFHKLISILYRMDVSEGKLRGLLQELPDADAAELIAGMMLERVAQRQQTKTAFKQPRPEDDHEEKW